VEASLKRASDVVATLLNRRPGGSGGHVEPPREPELPHDWPEQLPFRKRPKPFSRAIPWTPVPAETRHDRRRPYELFVSQSVLRQVRGHLITARSGEPYGFLLGQVVYCPWSETPYLVIDSVRRESQNLPPANDVDRFRHAWVAATRDARHRRGEVIGWYHRHGVLGLRLSEWDLHLQEEFFPEAWHCALIVASTSKGLIGGFIQRSPRARLFRKGLAPFHELVDLDAKLVEGRKPSLVDWENYSAGEPVSVLKAKWPAPQTRLERWKAPDHASAGEPPTREDGAATAPRPSAPGRGLRGRSWTAAAHPRGEEPRPVREAGFSEDFSGAVKPRELRRPQGRAPATPGRGVAGPGTPDAASVDGETDRDGADMAPDTTARAIPETPPEAKAAARGSKKGSARRRTGRKRKPGATGKVAADPATGEAGDDGPAEDIAERPDAAAEGAWYSAEFAEAVWGELPFGLEASEPSIPDEERRPSAEADPTPASGSSPLPAPDPRGSRFELVPPFEAEPAEEQERSSLAWLVSLIGESLARARAEAENEKAREAHAAAARAKRSDDAPAEQPDAARVADEQPEVPEPPATEATEVPAAEAPDVEETPAAADATDGAPAGRTPSTPDPEVRPTRQPALARPPLATPPAKRRKTYVSASQNPDVDPEAEIPVVLFRDRQAWRPSPRLVRIAAGLAIVILGALALRVMASRGPALPPPAPAAQPPSLTDGGRPTPEFIELADGYLSGLQSYRERLLQHGLGRVDCERLTADFTVLVVAHRALVDYVAVTPSMAERFSGLDAEMTPARRRFEASGCPVPPDLGPAPVDPASAAAS